ncbi:MAG TPA: glycosyltransferase, partial [bacterium]|nr:glycosyltransferase [bacterium]
RLFHMLEYLGKKHAVSIVSFVRPGGEKEAEACAARFKGLITVPITRGRIMLNAFISLFSGQSVNEGAYRSREMSGAAAGAAELIKPDIILVYRLRMAQHAPEGIPAVIDIVDSMALVNKRRAQYEKNPLMKLYCVIDAARILKAEKKLRERFKAVILNAEEDAAYIGAGKTTVVPNGMPRPKKAVKRGRKGEGVTAGFMGNMAYPPNADAMEYFFKYIWKKTSDSVKSIKMIIAGGQSRAAGRLIKGSKNVLVKGYVKDAVREISGWDMALAPVRYGAGRQNKILDAWAAGVPVVSTVFAARGVYGRDGYNMLVAKDAGEFAEKAALLARDRRLGRRLADGGRETLEKYFIREKSGEKMNKILMAAVKTR